MSFFVTKKCNPKKKCCVFTTQKRPTIPYKPLSFCYCTLRLRMRKNVQKSFDIQKTTPKIIVRYSANLTYTMPYNTLQWGRYFAKNGDNSQNHNLNH